ncbi:class I adenylate-forming enzyme family protein [Streptomyces specialis]|uniref:class I adenylate-forming enzyme family protein n=1 Tax=Streptomyces specialis TaxID=498367 RepID=UPI00389AF9E5
MSVEKNGKSGPGAVAGPSWTGVTDLLRLRAERFPDRVALRVVSGDGTESGITYGRWRRRVNRVARGLLGAGVRRGDRIALLFGGMDWTDYAVAYLAVRSAGASGVHLHAGAAPAEQRRRLRQCDVRGVIHGAGLAPPPDSGVRWAETVTGLDSGDERPPGVELRPGDIADVLYTSGTTGPAKAFTNPHGNLTFGRGPEGLLQFGTPAPLLAPMPLGTTSSATTVAIIALTSPAALVLSPVDDVERMGTLIEADRIGSVMITPWTALRMIASGLDTRHALDSVERIAIASAPLPPAVSRRLLRLFPKATLSTAYSQSEAVPAVVVNTFDPERPASLGRPAPGTELSVVDEHGRPVPPGAVGEIRLRSAAPPRRHLDPEREARARAGGWRWTGDLGWQDTDGHLYLFDRREDVLGEGPDRVSSVAVEAALYEHPAVLEAAVVAVTGPDGGPPATHAVVVLREPGALPELRPFLTGRLRPGEVPAHVHAWPALPRGVTGKALKPRVRERLRAAAPCRGPRPAGPGRWSRSPAASTASTGTAVFGACGAGGTRTGASSADRSGRITTRQTSRATTAKTAAARNPEAAPSASTSRGSPVSFRVTVP